MTTRIPVLCDSCIHRGPSNYATGKRLCNAFPTGIPRDILNMESDHRQPHPLDNGISYDMDPEEQGILDLHLELRDLIRLNVEGE